MMRGNTRREVRRYGVLGLALIAALALGIAVAVRSQLGHNSSEVPLAAVFAGWYGHDPVSGDCQGGLGSTHWNDSPDTGGVVYEPYKGYYCSSDPEIVAWQLDQMEKAGISVVLYSWWGWGDTDLDGRVEGHADRHVNNALTEMLRQIRASGSRIRVAVIVEPFTKTQAGIELSRLTNSQRRMVLDYLWERYYRAYPAQMFTWEGKPLVVAFDPMRLPPDERFTVRHWTGRSKSPETLGEGWDWSFAPREESVSQDGVAFVYPRFDEHYLASAGASYLTWELRRVDPLLEEGVYERQWERLKEDRNGIRMIVLYGWNLYGEQAHIEPSTGGSAPVEDRYVEKTRRLYEAFVEGRP